MAVDITVQETIDVVDITVNPNIIEVNVTRTSGGRGSQDLQQVTDEGNTTTNDIIVRHSTDNEVVIESITDSSQISVNQGTAGVTLASQKIGGVTEALIQMTSDKGYNIITEGAIQLSNSDNNTNIDLNDSGLSLSSLGVNQRINLSNGVDDVSIKTDLIDGTYTQQLPNKSGTFAMLSDAIPYTGATSDVNLGEFGLLTGNIEFDNTPTNIPTSAGSMVWNDTDGTVDLKLKGGNVTLQIGQESVIRVVNKTATNINLLEANYQAVRVTGAQGQRLKVDLAQATSDTLSAETIGLVTETINNNQEGFITTSGLIRNVNTTGSLQSETWADGDILYLSPTVAGQITKVKPVAPNHLVIIGYVVSAHATQGSIFVKVDNGYELDELHNVKIASATNGQALTYTSATDIWENKTIIEDAIANGVTDKAPSQNAVFDALALKQDSLKTFNRTQGVYYFEDFIGSQSGNLTTSYGQVITLLSGTGAGCTTTNAILNKTNQQGVVRHTTGTLLSGNAGFTLGNASLFIGQGAISLETYTTIETLSNATERFFTFFGYGVPSNWQNNPNAIFITYDEGGSINFNAGGASANFKCYTKLASVTTVTTTSVPVVASQWYKLRIDINASASSVGFYIDGNLVATHTTNIPASTTGMSVVNLINKTVGTTARTMQTDYFMYEEIFTTAR